MGLGAALLAITTGLLVKGAVMVLSLWLLAALGRALFAPDAAGRFHVEPEDRSGARVLWASLALFAFSELVCSVETYVILRATTVTSVAHALTSALGMGLFGLWLYDHADGRVLRFGQPRCAARRLCGTCTLARPEGCNLRVTAGLVASFVALAALVPLFVAIDPLGTDLRRFVLPFAAPNALYDRVVVPWLGAHAPTLSPTAEAFVMGSTELFVELRATPLVAFVVAALGTVRLLRGDLRGGARLAALAGGMLCYVFLELVCYRGIGDVLLGSLVHESAELWFMVFTVELLRRSFPRAARPTVSA